MKLDDFIERLIDLRRLTGGDIEVALDVGCGEVFETAAAEIQNVLPEPFKNRNGEVCWKTAPGPVNTGRIISVY